VSGAVPGVALEQSRRGVQEEREEHGVGLGDIERALEGAAGGGRVAEGVACDGLQQLSLNPPDRLEYRSGACSTPETRPSA
jgi:hypothetical protein